MRLRSGKIIFKFNVKAKEFIPFARSKLKADSREFKPLKNKEFRAKIVKDVIKETVNEVDPCFITYLNKETGQYVHLMATVKNIPKNLVKV